jgi:two-component system KDP operon response regulator KdpE
VLVVDDDPRLQRTLTIALRAHGNEVVTAADGRTAVQSVTEDAPDVVILDLGLPKKNGLLVGEQIAEDLRPRPLLIAVTGYGDQATRELAAAAGFDHFLIKPADPFDIEALIEAHLQSAGWNRLG